MRFCKNLLTATILLSATACTGAGELGVSQRLKDVEKLNNTVAVGSAFTKNLTDNYREFANYQQNERYDLSDARHFARKGLLAASGAPVMPEPVHAWKVEDSELATLSNARSRLIRILDIGARNNHPVIAANAQSNFDCWLEQSEEYWRKDNRLPCKSEYLSAMAELEEHLVPGAIPSDVVDRRQRPDLPTPPFEPIQSDPEKSTDRKNVTAEHMSGPESAKKPLQPDNAKFLTFFDWDSDQISESAGRVIESVASEVLENESLKTITLTGHADTSGPEKYNIRLGQKRANAVKSALIEKGLDSANITTQSRGENDLMVQTQDGVREPSNRRVEITFK